MDILNFISWIKGGRYSTTIPNNAVTVVGVPNPNRDDKYLPVTVPVSSFGGGSNIGKLLGGGIVVSEWDENGVKKCLIASLTNLGSIPWTTPAFQSGPAIGILAQDFQNGLQNTNAIIAQAGVLDTTYAAGRAKLFASGGFNDWYLPSNLEINTCYQSALIVNKVLGVTNGFANSNYWSSTENSTTSAYYKNIYVGDLFATVKSISYDVRAVRIHTL
jgi:hypothetical protein